MTTQKADFIVVGAGIAGASAAYELSAKGKVVLLEMERAPGYHATGRSAAIMSENYGPALWSRLVTGSRAFLEAPPPGFTDVPLVSPRGALFLAHDHERDALRIQEQEMRRRGAAVEVMSPREALGLCPVLKPAEFALALYEPDCRDIDTNALLSAYLKAFRARRRPHHEGARREDRACRPMLEGHNAEGPLRSADPHQRRGRMGPAHCSAGRPSIAQCRPVPAHCRDVRSTGRQRYSYLADDLRRRGDLLLQAGSGADYGVASRYGAVGTLRRTSR